MKITGGVIGIISVVLLGLGLSCAACQAISSSGSNISFKQLNKPLP